MRTSLNLRLENEVALITGAGSGIGRAIAKKFADEGCSVICADISAEGVKKTVDDIVSNGSKAVAIVMDQGNPESIEAAFAEGYSTFGKITQVVLSAAISSVANLEETTLEMWDRVIRVNLSGIFYCLKTMHQYLKKQGGSVILVSSTAAWSGGNGQTPAYIASKGGIGSLARYCAREWGSDGIRVNTLMPGVTETEIFGHILMPDGTPANEVPGFDLGERFDPEKMLLGRIANADDPANAALFLASQESSYITGTTLEVHGGKYIYNN